MTDDAFFNGFLTGVAVTVVGFFFILFFFLGPWIQDTGENVVRKQAVSRGFAEWSVNTNSLDREFHWKD